MYCNKATLKLALDKGFTYCTCSNGGYPDCICESKVYGNVRLEDVQRWVRKKHLIHICIDWMDNNTYFPELVSPKFTEFMEGSEGEYFTYDEALEAAIVEALNLI